MIWPKLPYDKILCLQYANAWHGNLNINHQHITSLRKPKCGNFAIFKDVHRPTTLEMKKILGRNDINRLWSHRNHYKMQHISLCWHIKYNRYNVLELIITGKIKGPLQFAKSSPAFTRRQLKQKKQNGYGPQLLLHKFDHTAQFFNRIIPSSMTKYMTSKRPVMKR